MGSLLRSTVRLLALLTIVGTYWTIELYYAWFKAWGDAHFDDWYSVLAYAGIVSAAFLFLESLRHP